MPPPGEPAKMVFEPGDNSVKITVSAQGYSEEAELQILELVTGEPGQMRPRVVHIEPLKGRTDLDFAAPAKLPGKYYALVMDGLYPDFKFSGAEQAFALDGKDLSLKLKAGQKATWMSQLPLGPLPEDTLSGEPVPPEEGNKGGEPPEGTK